MDACISSNVLPLVSGTSLAMNRTPKPQMLENMKNVPEKCTNSHVQVERGREERERERERERES